MIVHETRSCLVSGLCYVLSFTSLCLTLLSANAGVEQMALATLQHDYYASQRAGLADQALGGTSIEPALRAVREPSPGSLMVRGLDPSRPAFWDFSPAGVVEGPGRPPLDRRSESGVLFDYEAVVRIVVGLLAVLMGVRTVAGQRQDRTLQALLDLPLRHPTVALAKLAGAGVALGLVMVTLGSGAALLVWSRESTLLTADLAASIALVSVVGLTYASALVGVGMVIGALAPSLAAAGTIGIGVWGLLALAYPQLATFAAHGVAPLPARPVVEGQQRTLYQGRFASTREVVGRSAADWDMDPGPAFLLNPEDATRALLADLWRTDSLETRYLLDVIENRAREAEHRHDGFVTWLSAAAPSTTFTRAVAALAETGSAAERRWRDAADARQAALAEHLFDNLPRLALLVPSDDAHQRIGIDVRPMPTAAALPPFEPPERSLRTRLSDARRDLVLLLVFLVLSAGLAVWQFPGHATRRR